MKYDRFWDIHLTANNRYYDWGGDIRPMADYQAGKVGGSALYLVPESKGPDFCYPIRIGLPLLNPKLANMQKGVVASVVTVDELNEAASRTDSNDDVAKALVAWVANQDAKGKIRLTAHGDEAGRIGMYPDGNHRGLEGTQARNLAKWLINNGLKARDSATRDSTTRPGRVGGAAAAMAASLGLLKASDPTTPAHPGGLLTVALCVCCGAVGNYGDHATIPAVEQVSREFFFHGIRGITVTGTMDTSIIVPTLDSFYKGEFKIYFKILHEGGWSRSSDNVKNQELEQLLITNPSPWRPVLDQIQGYSPNIVIPNTQGGIRNLDGFQKITLYAKILTAEKYYDAYGAYRAGQWITKRLDGQGYVKASTAKVKVLK